MNAWMGGRSARSARRGAAGGLMNWDSYTLLQKSVCSLNRTAYNRFRSAVKALHLQTILDLYPSGAIIMQATLFTLPIFENKAGAGRRKQISTVQIPLYLSAEDLTLAVTFAVRNAWRALEGWTISPERIQNSLISYWRSEREASPQKALANALTMAYGVEPKALPAAPTALMALINGGVPFDDARIQRAVKALQNKFPSTPWENLIEAAITAQASILDDVEF